MLTIRDAHIEDNRAFNTLLSNSGGIGLFRAIFGQFTFSAVIEYSLMTITAVSGVDEEKECHALIAINDTTSVSSDPGSFGSVIKQLTQVMDVKVVNKSV